MVWRLLLVLVAGMFLVGVPATAFAQSANECEVIDFVYDGSRWLPAIPDSVPHVDVANSSARGVVLGAGGVTELKGVYGTAIMQYQWGSRRIHPSAPTWVYTGTRVVASFTGGRGVQFKACWYAPDPSVRLPADPSTSGWFPFLTVVGAFVIGGRLLYIARS